MCVCEITNKGKQHRSTLGPSSLWVQLLVVLCLRSIKATLSCCCSAEMMSQIELAMFVLHIFIFFCFAVRCLLTVRYRGIVALGLLPQTAGMCATVRVSTLPPAACACCDVTVFHRLSAAQTAYRYWLINLIYLWPVAVSLGETLANTIRYCVRIAVHSLFQWRLFFSFCHFQVCLCVLDLTIKYKSWDFIKVGFFSDFTHNLGMFKCYHIVFIKPATHWLMLLIIS